jgi:hypothetical protein
MVAARARSSVAMTHERLPDAGTAERQKAVWRDRLRELQRVLQG